MESFLEFIGGWNLKEPEPKKLLKQNLRDFEEAKYVLTEKNYSPCIIFLLTGLRIYTGEYKAQGPTLCPTVGRALRGPRALYSPV